MHSVARLIALSPGPIPSFAVLHTENQAFNCATLQSWEIRPGDMATLCRRAIQF